MPDAKAVVTVRRNCGGCWIIIQDPSCKYYERAIRISELPFPNGVPFRIWAEQALKANDRADLEQLESRIKSARRYGGTTVTVSIPDLEKLIEHSRRLQ